jgi:hypothetical protein
VRPFQFQGIFVYFMTYNFHGNRTNFFAIFGRFWNIIGILLFILRNSYFYQEGLLVLFHLRSTLSGHIQVLSGGSFGCPSCHMLVQAPQSEDAAEKHQNSHTIGIPSAHGGQNTIQQSPSKFLCHGGQESDHNNT